MTSRPNILIACLLLLFLSTALPTTPARAGAIIMEIFYLPHGPAMKVVAEIEKIGAEFKQVTISKYSFEDPGSRDLIRKYQLTEHTPVAVFINGANSFTVGDRSLRLRNFPKGDAFVPMFAGEWDYDDLRAILVGMAGGQ